MYTCVCVCVHVCMRICIYIVYVDLSGIDSSSVVATFPCPDDSFLECIYIYIFEEYVYSVGGW